jgi:hypothetical protein
MRLLLDPQRFGYMDSPRDTRPRTQRFLPLLQRREFAKINIDVWSIYNLGQSRNARNK